MKNLKVRAKLLTGFAILLLLTAVIGIISISTSAIFLNRIETMTKLNRENEGIVSVTEAHYVWRHNLVSAAATGGEFLGSLDPDRCALGTWLQGEVAKGIDDSEILQYLTTVASPHAFIHREAEGVITHINNGEHDAAMEMVFETILPRTQEVIDILNNAERRYSTLVDVLDDEIYGLSVVVLTVNAVTLALSVVIAICLAIYISSLISKPLTILSEFMKKAGTVGDISLRAEDIEVIGKMSQIKDEIGQAIGNTASFVQHITSIAEKMKSVSEGDLTVDIEPLSADDVMSNALRQMIGNLNNMFGEIHLSSSQVTTGAKQIADGSQNLAQGATEQAASVEELSSSIAEIFTKTKTNEEMAGRAAALANEIRGNAENGTRQMDEMISAVQDINQSSQNINKVIKVIDDIAFQTNILALNAAVEAARAGQHGKGFAVVAEEVRNLASKSAEAAKETGNMISDSIEKAELGSRIAGETASSLKEIVSGINESTQIVNDIAKSSEEQSLGIEQINVGIDQVAQVVQQNSATAQESAAASEEMSSQSSLLEELISQFKLKDNSLGFRHLPPGPHFPDGV